MTTTEYINAHPEHRHLEGDALWDAMEQSMLHQQQGQTIISHLLPWWKRYQLRYLFYVRKPNGVFATEQSSSERCKKCKRGTSCTLMIIDLSDSGRSVTYCTGCGSELETEPNTNISHKVYKLKTWLKKYGWVILEASHIFRYDTEGRYSLFGDEGHYVKGYVYDNEWKLTKTVMNPRKWWEYIIIKKR